MRVWWGSWQKSLLLPSTIPAAPHPAMPYQHPRCSIPSHLSCIKWKISTFCPHMEERSLPHWCSGCRPILSWINTGAICRLADMEMFVFQGDPPPSLLLALTPSLLQLYLASTPFLISRRNVKLREKTSNFRGHYIKGTRSNRWCWMINHCNDKSHPHTETQIRIKSKYWYSG